MAASFTLPDLEKRVQERAKASADVLLDTRKLLDRGVVHCARNWVKRPSRQPSPPSVRIAIA